MAATYETLSIEEDGEVLKVVLNRPSVANAINTKMGFELLQLFSELLLHPARYRCAVLTGAGERAFCAGGDLKERNGMSDEQWQAQHLIFERMVFAISECPIPLITAVNGAAIAGGLEVALASDFIYASTHARFALTEVTLGIMPGNGGTQNLTRAAGDRRAKEIILTGAPFSAQEALTWGVINRICEPGAVVEESMKTAKAIAANAPLAVRQAKKSIRQAMDSTLQNGMLFEIEAYGKLISTRDRLEGVRAYNERRAPVFIGS